MKHARTKASDLNKICINLDGMPFENDFKTILFTVTVFLSCYSFLSMIQKL